MRCLKHVATGCIYQTKNQTFTLVFSFSFYSVFSFSFSAKPNLQHSTLQTSNLQPLSPTFKPPPLPPTFNKQQPSNLHCPPNSGQARPRFIQRGKFTTCLFVVNVVYVECQCYCFFIFSLQNWNLKQICFKIAGTEKKENKREEGE